MIDVTVPCGLQLRPGPEAFPPLGTGLPLCLALTGGDRGREGEVRSSHLQEVLTDFIVEFYLLLFFP